MFKKIREKMVAEWHTIVTGAEHETKAVLEWLLTELEGEFMTVEAKLDAIAAKLETIVAPTPVDISGLATTVDLAALSAKVDALIATVGTETPAPTPAPAPAA